MGFALDTPSGYSIERLDKVVHSRTEFACGVEALDTFLRTQAFQNQTKNTLATHVLLEAVPPDEATAAMRPVIGYVSLVNAELPLVDAPDSIRKMTKASRLPAILLARMAVDHRHQGRKLGEFLLKYALKCCCEVSQMSGCFAVLVDAKDDKVKAFYTKYGFMPLPDHDLRLYILIATVIRLFTENSA